MAETAASGILAGKRGLVMGVANNRSIAWGIAQAARRHGAAPASPPQRAPPQNRAAPLPPAPPGAAPRAPPRPGPALPSTYRGPALKKRVEPLAQELGGIVVGHCD